MHPLTLIRQRLAEHQPEQFDLLATTRQAAVAVILREREPSSMEILFIKRAEKTGDPWSGHMAFPGGHREAEDPDLRSAAIRETREEIGLNLAEAEYLGPLDEQHAMARGRRLNMLIAPHVFHLESDPQFTPNYEVDEVVWSELAPLMRGDLHHWEARPMAGTPTTFNGYRLERGHFVWGLTYRMLNSFFLIVDPEWQAPPEK